MTDVVNIQQEEAWNGYEGEHWATHADRYDAVNSGFNPVLLSAAIRPGESVLDLGCGTGQLTRLAASAARPGGRALGIDLSGPMLTVARQRSAGVDFVRGDAQTHPFDPAGFDVAISRFGVMFYADPIAAFDNVRRALRPGGRLAFVCLREVAGTDLGTVFGALTGDLPAPGHAGPTSLADPVDVRAILGAARFEDVRCEPVEADQIWGRDVGGATAFIAAWGPVRHQLRQRDPDSARRAVDALAAALTPFERDGAVRLRGAAWLVTAARGAA